MFLYRRVKMKTTSTISGPNDVICVIWALGKLFYSCFSKILINFYSYYYHHNTHIIVHKTLVWVFLFICDVNIIFLDFQMRRWCNHRLGPSTLAITHMSPHNHNLTSTCPTIYSYANTTLKTLTGPEWQFYYRCSGQISIFYICNYIYRYRKCN